MHIGSSSRRPLSSVKIELLALLSLWSLPGRLATRSGNRSDRHMPDRIQIGLQPAGQVTFPDPQIFAFER
ncbi:hypothetical protein REMIM1_PF00098 (plasmid) [Rhizobium etli bv. mimosae str. Mim1]|nr:hypothetical protein REMIM1_PF00098 [Rhizobium etli bv. mimosae str. Mim1]